ncbi:MAG: cytidylate kinase-like family protein [Acidimicrobiia bacterium]|nr:cytidylate kinase-like family protein [Acidimicrobiia bacterium]
MTQSESFQRFLTTQLADHQTGEPPATQRTVHPFVTISREAGAGAHSLAKTMVKVFAEQDDEELFGTWQVFDRKLCEYVVEDPRLEGALDDLLSEAYHSRAEAFFSQLLKPAPDQEYVMTRVFRAVRSLAGVGKVILLGRGGSNATRGMGPSFRIRLVAPLDERVKRIAKQEHIDERSARERVRRLDTSRARLIKRHFGAAIDDPLEYDAVWNTAAVGYETIAEATAAVLRRRAADR